MAQIGVQQSTAEVRVYLHDYLRWFSAEVVRVADGVIAADKDLAIQEAALRLKANGVSSMQAAVFQHDPLAALTDAWVLAGTMARFFKDGAGSGLLGASQPLVVAVLDSLELQVDELAQRIAGAERVDDVRPRIQRFIREHPLQDLSFSRRSAALQVSALAAAAWRSDVRSAVASLEETARDASDRLSIYAEQLPNMARWQAEILIIESAREFLAKPFASLDEVDNRIAALDRKIGSIQEDIDTVTQLVVRTPDLLDTERTLVLEALARERAIILGSIDYQRAQTMASLTAERKAIVVAVEALRRASFTDLATETARSLDKIDKVSAARLQDVQNVSEAAIDRLFLRALELVFILAGSALAIVALARYRRKRSTPVIPDRARLADPFMTTPSLPLPPNRLHGSRR